MKAQKNKYIFGLLLILGLLSPLAISLGVNALAPTGGNLTCKNGEKVPSNLSSGDATGYCASNNRGGLTTTPDPAKTSLPTAKTNDCKPANGQKLDKSNCGILALIINVTNFLSAIVGIVIVIMITVGGIQYSAAGGNPSAVSAARQKIFNAVIALVLYIFGYALLQYLIPGGIF